MSEDIDPWGICVVADVKNVLFEEGPCGLRPPVVRVFGILKPRWKSYEGSIENAGAKIGLVLWRDRKPVLMGIDRIARALQCQPFRGDGLEPNDLKIWLQSVVLQGLAESVVLFDAGQEPLLELIRDPENSRGVVAR
jgi:hypothetical protein